MEAGTSTRPEGGTDYSPAAYAGSAVLTLLLPLVALVAAVVLLIGQDDPEKRRSLRAWAVVSAAWLALSPFVWLVLLTGPAS
jgi:hypothetical protein